MHEILNPRRWLLIALIAALLLPAPASARCRPDAPTTTIAALKGHGAAAVEPGRMVTVAGTVTGVFLGERELGGFYLQAPAADGLPAGIFVYLPRPEPAWRAALETGSDIQLRARLTRFHGRLQLDRVDWLAHCRRGRVAAQPVALDELKGASRARLSEVLVALPAGAVVTGNHELGRYGSLTLASRRLFRPTNGPYAPGGPRLILDDASYKAAPRPVPYLGPSGTRRVGDEVGAVTGVLTHAFDAWRLHPLRPPAFASTNPRPPAPPAPGDALRAGVFNVENYFVTLGERGAASVAELDRQRAKLVPAIRALDADLLAIAELENAPAAVRDLLSRLNTGVTRARRYRAVRGERRWGDDAIRVALFYRPSALELIKVPAGPQSPVFKRRPLTARFRSHNGRVFTAVAVHFKSKAGCPAGGDVDRGQGCWNLQRLREAQALVDWSTDPATAIDPGRLLILGDLNAYGAEDPVRHLTETGFTDLIAAHLPPGGRYTYVYRGESGFLDHALAGPTLAERIRGVHIWHINADEPALLGYDRPWIGRPQIYRASDHDPVMVDFVP